MTPLPLQRIVSPSGRERRWLLVVAVVSYVAVVALRFGVDNPNVPISSLLFIPVIAATLAVGLPGTLLASLAALVAQLLWLPTATPDDLSVWELGLRGLALVTPWLVFGLVFQALAENYRARTRSSQDLERMHADLGRRADQLERANARLEQTNAELARSNRDLEQFANVASHDLQEPLRVVTGFLDLFERRTGDRLDADERRYLAMMRSATERMSELISDVLAWSRAGSAPLELADVDTAELVRGTCETLAAAVEEAGAVVEVEDLPTIRGDAGQLRQLFQNLIGNALKFRADEPSRISVWAAPVPEGWRFQVRDNGIGIDPGEADRIFKMFQRLHGRDAYPGTGIGLAICSTVVERHGGRIWVEQTPGGGTTFCFTLAAGPLAAEVPPLPSGVREATG